MIKRPKSGARAARARNILMVNILNKSILNTLVHNLFLDRHGNNIYTSEHFIFTEVFLYTGVLVVFMK